MSDQGNPQNWTGFPVRRYGPSYEAGLFDQLDEDFFSISAEDGDIELQEDNVDNNTSEPIDAASEASDAAAVFYVTTENAAAMIGEDDNVPMKGDDDAATKASDEDIVSDVTTKDAVETAVPKKDDQDEVPKKGDEYEVPKDGEDAEFPQNGLRGF